MKFNEKTRIEVSMTAEERATFAKCADLIHAFLARLPEGACMDGYAINHDEDLGNMAYLLDTFANVGSVHCWESGGVEPKAQTFPFTVMGILNVEAENQKKAIAQMENWNDEHSELKIVRWDNYNS